MLVYEGAALHDHPAASWRLFSRLSLDRFGPSRGSPSPANGSSVRELCRLAKPYHSWTSFHINLARFILIARNLRRGSGRWARKTFGRANWKLVSTSDSVWPRPYTNLRWFALTLVKMKFACESTLVDASFSPFGNPSQRKLCAISANELQDMSALKCYFSTYLYSWGSLWLLAGSHCINWYKWRNCRRIRFREFRVKLLNKPANSNDNASRPQ